jgi:cbb3-type cytochrome oxidase maturation protein
MEIVFVLLPISLFLIGLAIAIFVWAVNSGQFDDLDRQGYEILFERDKNKDNEKNKDKEKNRISHDSAGDES